MPPPEGLERLVEQFERNRDATDKRIDLLGCDLYGLTEEEMAVVVRCR